MSGSQKIGLFVSVDGPNGVGKSSLIEGVASRLRAQNFSIHVTKEVTKTALGGFIRSNHKEYKGKTLAFLLAADRQSHIEHDILPALQHVDVVITDRYLDSSLVFQTLDGVDLSFIWKLNEDFPKPNLSIIVLSAPDVIKSRLAIREQLDRFEAEFNREQEVKLFEEAASFLYGQGFNVFKYYNDDASIEDGANALADTILSVLKTRTEK